MPAESFAANMWLKSVLFNNDDLKAILGEPFTTSTIIKRRTNYQVGDALYIPQTGNGHIYAVTVAGRTADIEPDFDDTLDSLTIDGTVTWKESGEVGIRPRVFEGVAPREATEPFIVFNLQEPDTTKAVGGGSPDLFGNYMFQVRGTDKGNDKTVVAKIADIIDDLLNTGELEFYYQVTFNNRVYEILGCYRDLPVDFTEVVNDVRYLHMGGLYRITVAAIPN